MEIRKIGTVKTLQEFMEAVWKEPQHLDEGRHIFRGQTDDRPLLPKLFRSNRTAGELSQLEHVLFQQFRERCPYLLPSLPDNPYNQISLAQHRGLPTRLLDWTSNPLMALFFAVESNSPPAPIVFVYHASQDQLDRGKMLTSYPGPNMPGHEGTVVLSPTSHSQRVVAQAGWHTSHSLDGLDEHSLCNVAMNDSEEDSKRLATIEIDWPQAGAIRQELRAMGIHAATVYGDLTSIFTEIQNDLHVSPGMRRDVQHWKKR